MSEDELKDMIEPNMWLWVRRIAIAIIVAEYALLLAAFVMLFFAKTIGYVWIPLLVVIVSKTATLTPLPSVNKSDYSDYIIKEDKDGSRN